MAGVLSASLAMAQAPASTHQRLAALTGGDLSVKGFQKLTASMDPGMLLLASRFEPKAGPVFGPAAAGGDATLQAASGAPGQEVSSDDGAAVIRLQDLSPDAARIWNAANPVAPGPNPAARPFKLNTGSVLDEARAVDCMTAAIYYEAAMESTDGQRAVAQVVLNRLRHPAFPKTVCGVVFQGSNRSTGCQFSFTCDGSLNRTPSEAGWSRARQVAMAALNGYVMKKVGNATHYHANYVAPYWSPSLLKVGTIGAHIFYRWTGGWGLPPAFGGRYAGGEMSGLRLTALDGLAKTGGAKLELAANVEPPSAPVAAVEEAAPKPAPAGEQSPEEILGGGELVTAASVVGKDAAEIAKPEELDWAGRPKPKTPPRVAMPARMF